MSIKEDPLETQVNNHLTFREKSMLNLKTLSEREKQLNNLAA